MKTLVLKKLSSHKLDLKSPQKEAFMLLNIILTVGCIGTKSMQNTSAYKEARSSGKWLHEYLFDPRSIQ